MVWTEIGLYLGQHLMECDSLCWSAFWGAEKRNAAFPKNAILKWTCHLALRIPLFPMAVSVFANKNNATFPQDTRVESLGRSILQRNAACLQPALQMRFTQKSEQANVETQRSFSQRPIYGITADWRETVFSWTPNHAFWPQIRSPNQAPLPERSS